MASHDRSRDNEIIYEMHHALSSIDRSHPCASASSFLRLVAQNRAALHLRNVNSARDMYKASVHRFKQTANSAPSVTKSVYAAVRAKLELRN